MSDMDKVYQPPGRKRIIIPYLTFQLGVGLLLFSGSIFYLCLSAYGGAHSRMSGYSARNARRAAVMAILGLIITVIIIRNIVLLARSRLTSLTLLTGNAVIAGLSSLTGILMFPRKATPGEDISNDFSYIISTAFLCFTFIFSVVRLVHARRKATAEKAKMASPRSELVVGEKKLAV